ncbi:hypothetical protein DFH09DRAFT_1315452 [Mycena vulgaris]|nr:hypothetical protein DFH09DRAFT_1315452 [Mycena vulgaris]
MSADMSSGYPLCAFAAQGLAIVTAEDGLVALSGVAPVGSSADEAQKRLKNAETQRARKSA